MYIKVLYNNTNNEKKSGWAIFEPKTVSSYLKKNEKKRLTETGLEPTAFWLENLPSYPLG